MPDGKGFEKNKMIDFWAEAWEQAKRITAENKTGMPMTCK